MYKIITNDFRTPSSLSPLRTCVGNYRIHENIYDLIKLGSYFMSRECYSSRRS